MSGEEPTGRIVVSSESLPAEYLECLEIDESGPEDGSSHPPCCIHPVEVDL